MKKLILFLLPIFLLIQNEANSAERVKEFQKFPFVGIVKYNNGPVCTGFLIRHGVLATAKHCFSHHNIDDLNFEPNKLRLVFPKKNGNIDFNNVTVEKEDILKLVLDSGSNDLAYIIYKREKTRTEITLPPFEVNLDEEILDETDVFRVGFPMGENHVFDKVLTKDCQFTGKTDFFRPTITDPGYEGLLYDTDCPAWFGDSGGPIFENNKESKKMVIHGVLTHTFEVNFAGEIEESSKETDSIGEYVKTSNFSPFRLADDFQNTLDEEEKLFQERTPELASIEPEEERELPAPPQKEEAQIEIKAEDSKPSNSIISQILGLFLKIIKLLLEII